MNMLLLSMGFEIENILRFYRESISSIIEFGWFNINMLLLMLWLFSLWIVILLLFPTKIPKHSPDVLSTSNQQS